MTRTGAMMQPKARCATNAEYAELQVVHDQPGRIGSDSNGMRSGFVGKHTACDWGICLRGIEGKLEPTVFLQVAGSSGGIGASIVPDVEIVGSLSEGGFVAL